ncbi:type VI secretion system tube protein Hcp [Bradyrhizobium sp. Ash2021]|uniref:type VI secretion system tube protein Hcp n=1 Tax=Bradyrhizobium sp. Ash2021 TaxID=2954771 RepID=UPI0028161E5F|nr:type VI secretion system tube protein Hcp [Bradyrhizobium sp. Ash2021]WMT71569.1 type VI secretion system tube protein Hcp [Bradyrhizobium sp. Ash2021]
MQVQSQRKSSKELKTIEVSNELTEDVLGNVSAGAFNAFARFGDIKGESTDKDHKDWIEILSYNH